MYKYRRPFWLLLIVGTLLVHWLPQLAAQTSNRAALVVRFGENNVHTECITFTEEQITGYDLLLRSSLDVTADVQGAGVLICGISGTGCPAHDCLCQCRGGGQGCVYWSYWRQMGGHWQYSQAGASMAPVTNGTVDGWSWGPGGVSQAIPPPNLTFDQVCLPAATVTPVPPTATPTPTATATLIPASQISFSLDADTVEAGNCTTLRWQVENILAVYLNDVGVTGSENRQVCPEQTTTYRLRVVHASGEETRTLTLNVLPAAATATATRTPTSVPPAAGQATATTAVSPSPTGTPQPTTDADADATTSPTATPVDSSPLPTATPDIEWVTVPPLPTDTAVPATEVAALPPTPDETAAAPTAAADDRPVDEIATFDWLSYAIFGLLVLLLGGGLLIARQRG